MCNEACLDFVSRAVDKSDVQGKKVLEIGAFDVNGTPRNCIVKMEPSKYLGIDITKGKGVDEICSIYDIVDKYGKDSFDVVICTEVMEHIKDWKKAIGNMKKVVRKNGTILITTRSFGFPYHAWPYDYWRFEVDDMKNIFSDFKILQSEKGPDSPGVYIKVVKPETFSENDISSYELYSIVANKKKSDISLMDYLANFHRLAYLFTKDRLRPFLPQGLKDQLKKLFKTKN